MREFFVANSPAFAMLIVLIFVSLFLAWVFYTRTNPEEIERNQTHEVGIARITVTLVGGDSFERQITGTAERWESWGDDDDRIMIFSAKTKFDNWLQGNAKRGTILVSHNDVASMYVPLDKIKYITVRFEKHEVKA